MYHLIRYLVALSARGKFINDFASPKKKRKTTKNVSKDEDEVYSNNKIQNVSCCIVSITSGTILYMSKAFPGRVKDDTIIHLTYNEWRHIYLDIGDILLGDNGFRGMEAFNIINTGGIEMPLSNLHSKYRVIVENLLGRSKVFKCLSEMSRYPGRLNEDQICNLNDHYWRAVVYVYFDIERTCVRNIFSL
ncbi:hypothetical protein PPL_00843 [Heterostelium album PN500]|uniref:DDE Tnp4 domain-containing protein n=1 Tax=Heterostelium pallidum (strain ATCC 26659 / Pp 5 / PN500) TaxID=670386 RepID=D3AXL2_HETP5|nr:hypothetical protein PPL_00843 [Heterostelium album PN500]EFA86281.1 hypothetical protein PPL_00843 [Heterostelium album PN500]|eukprot:XP_020438386.1 hypothetical protein PPL_00843 [Heterostelium album PN500]